MIIKSTLAGQYVPRIFKSRKYFVDRVLHSLEHIVHFNL